MIFSRFRSWTAAALLGAVQAFSQEIANPRPPGQVEAISNFYVDDLGLYVSTTGAEIAHPLGAAWALKLRALADWIGIFPPDDYAERHAGHLGGGHDHHADPGGNPDAVPGGVVDAVSGASARAGSGGGSSEVRAEGGVGLLWRGRPGGRPATISVESRASYEPDYQSATALASGSLETHLGNTVWSGHMGTTLDRIDPAIATPVRGEVWPAHQLKLSMGGAVNQALTTRLSVGLGAAAAYLQGRLSSPYRQALVVTTLFPERLPSERLRLSGFAQASLHLGLGFGFHARQGFYYDSWNVRAWIPEMALSKELGPRFLLTAKHRYYFQREAEFYQASYAPSETPRTGDLRLGGLEEHTLGAEAEWRPAMAPFGLGPISLTVGYAWSYLEYWLVPGHYLTGQVARLGAAFEY